jgi:hypothetical protein
MNKAESALALRQLARSIQEARGATQELSGQLGRWREDLREGLEPLRRMSSASGGSTAAQLRERQAGSTRSLVSPLLAELQKGLGTLISKLTSSLTGSISRSLGGGLGGGLLSGIIGAGIGALTQRLFRRNQPVRVDNEIQARIVNFPSVTDLGFALNPASRLFGGRAVARGPAFTVEVQYREGAEDMVTARVASKLLEDNAAAGLWPGGGA